MSEPNYSPEQIEAAWQTADEFDGYDSSEYRVVNCDDSGAVIKRSEILGSRRNAWEIASDGRARGKGYKMRDAMRSQRRQRHAAEVRHRKDVATHQAQEAGIPGAVELFKRLNALEEQVVRQRTEIEAQKRR